MVRVHMRVVQHLSRFLVFVHVRVARPVPSAIDVGNHMEFPVLLTHFPEAYLCVNPCVCEVCWATW